jgi:hypothetical protein
MENNLGVLSFLLIGENFVEARHDIDLKVAAAELAAGGYGVEDNHLAAGQQDVELLLEKICASLRKFNVILKIVNLVIYPYGEKYCCVLSLKTKP